MPAKTGSGKLEGLTLGQRGVTVYSTGRAEAGPPVSGRMLRVSAGNRAMEQWETLGLCQRQGPIRVDCSGQAREDPGEGEALGSGGDWIQWILGLRGTPEQRRWSSVGEGSHLSASP